jgi:hypothetical protein
VNIGSEFKAEWVSKRRGESAVVEGEIRRMRLKLDGLFIIQNL